MLLVKLDTGDRDKEGEETDGVEFVEEGGVFRV
jgi:hypothetical protein